MCLLEEVVEEHRALKQLQNAARRGPALASKDRTTLGYGDKGFSTVAGRIFAIFWILTSAICLAQLFFCIAEVNTEIRQRGIGQVSTGKKVTNVDLEAANIDDDGVVGAAEFMIYRLKEMGKICKEDITAIMEQLLYENSANPFAQLLQKLNEEKGKSDAQGGDEVNNLGVGIALSMLKFYRSECIYT